MRGECHLVSTWDTDEGSTKNYQTGTKSTGSIACVAKANLVDGETFTLEDALGVSKVFEFDVSGDGVTEGNISVNVSEDTTADDIAARCRTRINSVVGLTISAGVTGSTVDLTQDHALVAGDTSIADTVTDAGFVPTDFSGGADRDYVTVPIQVAADNKLPFGQLTVDAVTANLYVVD